MTTKKTFTDDEGNKYELTPVLRTDENIMTLKPIPTATERKRGLTVVVWFERNDGSGDSDAIYNLKETQLTEPQAQAVADAIKELLSFVTKADDYPTQWYDLTVAVDAAREALQHGAEGNT